MQAELVRSELERLESNNPPPTPAQRELPPNRPRQNLIEHRRTLTGIPAESLSEAPKFLEDWKDVYGASLSPIRELPVEILNRIFELVVSEALYKHKTSLHHGGVPGTLSKLLCLSQVGAIP